MTTRDVLLRSAATHFSATGYAAANVRAILADAGVTAPSMYHHFGNKAGLYVAVATAAYDDMLTRFTAAAARGDDPGARVEAVIDAVCELRREHPGVARFLGVIEQDVARHPELAELAVAQKGLSDFWFTTLGAGRGDAGRVLAMRSIVEGFLRVGDENLADAVLRATAETLRVLVRSGLDQGCNPGQQ